MQYKICEDFYEKVVKKLKSIEKKCKEYGNPFIFKVVGNSIEEVNGTYYKFIIVEVEGTAKINDFECVAVLENHEHGNIIRKINTNIDIPQRFMFSDNQCEHCNTKRKRNTLYIIHNTKTNEFKQVGKNCLMLYTNGLNSTYVTSFVDGVTTLQECNGVVGVGVKHYISVKKVIGYALETINKIGYLSANSNCSTKNLVSILINERCSINKRVKSANNYLKNYYNTKLFNDDDFNKEETKETVEKIIEYYLSLKNNNEFINNVQVILKEGYVEHQNLGFLCYLPRGYAKYIEEENKKKLDEKSCYFGEVGKRYKDINLYSFENIASCETMFGIMYIYKIILEDGNVLIWKSSSHISNNDIMNVNAITFTVKSHDVYKEVKQTNITRCKLITK